MQIPHTEQEKKLLLWVNEALREGEAFIENQRGYEDIETAVDYILGEQIQGMRHTKLSSKSFNRLGKIVGDTVSSLTDIKPMFSYSTNNTEFEKQAEVFNKLSVAWWLNNFIDIQLGAAIQLAQPAGCAYLQLRWNQDLHNGEGDLELVPRDCRDVLPIRPVSSMSIQDSEGVIVKEMLTVNELKARYPDKAHRIRADRDLATAFPNRKSRYERLMSKMGLRSPALTRLLAGKTTMKFKIPGKEVYTIYVKDRSVNETDSTIKMGYGPNGEKYSWSYDVPKGSPLYPRNRTIVATEDMVLYDGPNIWWFSKFPLVRIVNDLSFVYRGCYLGKSAVKDLIPIQDVINEIVNGTIDATRKALAPNMIGDSRAISQKELNKFNSRRSGQKLRIRTFSGKPLMFEDPPQLPSYVFELLSFMVEQIEYTSGVTDLTSLARARQLPAMESTEAIMQALSPSTRLKGRLMEASLRELAEFVKMAFMQFYTAPRRIAMLGPEGLTRADFDFDPDTMIPSDPGFRTDPEQGTLIANDERFSGKTRMERALELGKSVNFFISPNSMLEITLMTKKSQAMLLRKMGEIDHTTLLETLEFGNIQEINERLGSELDQKIQLAEQLTAGTPGRPNSFAAPANVETKGDGRPVISTS